MKKAFQFSLANLLLLLSPIVFSQTPGIKVNQQRIEARIFELANFGKDQNGKGYRVGFTKGDQEGRAWYIGLLKKAGLDVNIDEAGNIIGRRKGKNPSLKPIAFGSHIDMVPDGGNYDGCVGSIGALEVIETLNEKNMVTNHPLEVIIFSNEEGGTVGSNAMVGHLSPTGLKIVSQSGLTMTEGIRAIGGNPDNIRNCIRNKGDLKAFLELHIEQGGILDKENIQIGVVEGIVGIEHWDVLVEGFANHAGTTPMNMRQDALLAASKLVIAVNEVIISYEGNQVGTIGKITALPGAYNVIPGKVTMGLEIRDLSYDKIWRLFGDIERKAADLALATGTKISFNYQENPSKPALTEKSIQDKIVASTKKLGLTFKHMQSGAGHDSQEMAVIAPVGMISYRALAASVIHPKNLQKQWTWQTGPMFYYIQFCQSIKRTED